MILNGGGEDGLSNWTIIQGVVESLEEGVCNGTTPYEGEKYFCVGGLCEQTDVLAICTQNVDVTAYMDSIDGGGFQVRFGGMLSNYNGNDIPEIQLRYLNENGSTLGESGVLTSLNSNWTLMEMTELIPEQTRSIILTLKGTQVAGNFNDSYFDEVFLELGVPNLSCEEQMSISEAQKGQNQLKIYPNPTSSHCILGIEGMNLRGARVIVRNTSGVSIDCELSASNHQIRVNTESLPNGVYLFQIISKGQVLGHGRFVVLR